VKGFLLVSIFFVVFAGVIGGALFLAGFLVKSMHLSQDAENAVMVIGAIAALMIGGLLMKQLHAMIQRQM